MMRLRLPPLGSDQLEFALGKVWLDVPWGGRSPRGLTRAGISLSLSSEAQKSVRDSVDPDQIEIWPSGQKGPFVYEGAPLLGSSF